jgi:hypothetical protein
MKTTIDIADALLLDAKHLAAERGETLREVVEEGLRMALQRLRDAPAATYRFEPLVIKHGSLTEAGAARSLHQHIIEAYDEQRSAP